MRAVTLFLLVFLFVTCKRDKPVTPVSDCQTYTFEDSPFGPEITMADVTYHSPCFNPNNKDEIIYIKNNNISGKAELRKRNLLTKEDNFLAAAWVLNSPRWHKNGWIVFDYNYNIYKVKENGDSLTRLTNEGQSYFPSWNINGSAVIFRRVDESPWPNLNIIDNNGNLIQVLDSTIGGHRTTSWSPVENKIAYNRHKGIGLSFVDQKQLGEVKDVTNHELGILSLSWFSNGEWITWASLFQFGKTNINTGETKILRQGCYALRYSRPAVSPDDTKIIVERDDIRKTGPSSGYQETYLYIMNADGSNEKKIEF